MRSLMHKKTLLSGPAILRNEGAPNALNPLAADRNHDSRRVLHSLPNALNAPPLVIGSLVLW